MNASPLPNLLDKFDSAVASLSLELANDGMGLALDFDGTLSELVDVPDAAVIHPDALLPLQSLARKLRFVAVVSGRSGRDIERRVNIDGIVYIGNHGAEWIVDGVLSSTAIPDSPDMHAAVDMLAAATEDPGVEVERKGFSVSIHYRRAIDEPAVVQRLKAALNHLPHAPHAGDIETFWGNKLLEVRRKGMANKGTALDRAIRDWRLNTVIFLGDDTTDADALRVLRKRRASGIVNGLGVAAIQDGTPASVLDSADYSLNGVAEVAAFLTRLDSAIP